MLQRDLRLRLLQNGYTPLPNRGKPPVLTGWPDAVVTPEAVMEWPETPTTGVRLDGGLLAVDVDVDHPVANEIIERLPAAVREKLARAPERRGTASPYKRALFCRGPLTFGRDAAGTWADPEGKTHNVEIFGSGARRQFGAYGAHTITRAGRIQHTYFWPDRARDLRTVPLAELPVLDESEIEAVLQAAREAFRAAGWTPAAPERPGGGTGQPVTETVHDLAADVVLDISWGRDAGGLIDGGYTVAEAEAALLGLADDRGDEFQFGAILGRCAGEPVTGHGTNPTRLGVGLDRDRRLFVHDFEDGRRHKPAFPPERVVAALRRLNGGDVPPAPEGDAAGDAPAGAAVDAPAGAEALVEAVHALHRDYVLYAANDLVLPRHNRQPGISTRMLLLTSPTIKVPTFQPSGRVKEEKYNVADMWLRWPHKTVVHGFTFDPTNEATVIESDGLAYYNLYRPVARPEEDDPEAVELFERLLAHLVPDQEQRDWFRNWIAAKTQHPEQPLAGVIHHAPFEGCGRNTLFNVLQLVLGHEYCTTILVQQLRGLDGQSAYTDWLEGKLLIFIPEVTILPPKYNSSRANMLDKIKSLIDPSRPLVQIVKKYRHTYSVRTTASFFLATNSIDAVELSDNDRRFTMLHGPERGKLDEQPWSDGLFNRLGELHSPEAARFGATLWRYLRALDADLTRARTALPTAAKEDMRRAAYAARADNRELLELVYDRLNEYKYITVEQVTKIVHDVAVSTFMEGAAAQRLTNVTLDALRARAVGDWLPMYTRGSNATKLAVRLPSGTRRTVRCFANGEDAAAALREAGESERAALLGLVDPRKSTGAV